MKTRDNGSVTVSTELLAQLGALIGKKLGLRFTENKQEDLRRIVLELAGNDPDSTPDAVMRHLLASSLNEEQILLLAGQLTTGETYFFREQNSLQALREHILPELIAARRSAQRSLRIWCAGCSSGEEPYTMAMILDRDLPDPATWKIHILATDINPQALEKARRGIYTKWSFRGVSKLKQDQYFLPAGKETWAVKPKYRANVTFAHLNLATDDYPALLNNTHSLDLIVCRNVMIYLLPETIERVIRGFYRCLQPGGWLIVSPSETSMLLASEFVPVSLPNATLYRKPGGTAEIRRSDHPILCGSAAQDLGDAARASDWNLDRQSAISTLPPPCLPLATPNSPAANSSAAYSAKSGYEEAVRAFQSDRHHQAEPLLAELLSLPGSDLTSGQRCRAMQMMARIHADQGRLETALDWCRKAQDQDKTNPGALYLQTMILQEMGRDQEARQALKRLLYLEPECIAAHTGLGSIALRERKPDEARRHFENSMALLATLPGQTAIAEMDGMSAGRLMETIATMMAKEGLR